MTKHSTLDNEIRALRPADNGWATSERGRTVMSRERDSTPAASRLKLPSAGRRKPAPHILVTAGLAGLVAVGTAAALITVATPDDPALAGCYSTLSGQADMTEAASDLVQELGPIGACRRTWQTIGQDVDTTNLVLCVTPSVDAAYSQRPTEWPLLKRVGRSVSSPRSSSRPNRPRG